MPWLVVTFALRLSWSYKEPPIEDLDVEDAADWEEAVRRAGTTYKDLLGMPYKIPNGMSTLELLADMPLFVLDIRPRE